MNAMTIHPSPRFSYREGKQPNRQTHGPSNEMSYENITDLTLIIASVVSGHVTSWDKGRAPLKKYLSHKIVFVKAWR